MDAKSSVGGGYAIYRGPNQISSISVPLCSFTEVQDAEFAAAVIKTQAALSNTEVPIAENVHVCLDNEAATTLLVEGYRVFELQLPETFLRSQEKIAR